MGLVGPEVGRSAVLDRLRTACELIPIVVAAQDEGNEAVTINMVRRYAQLNPNGAVLYCHLKGASRPIELNRYWRRAMIEHTILPWRTILPQLRSHDAAGPFWIKAEEQEARGYGRSQTSGFFGGNFWIARNDYVAGLPECMPYPRSRTEEWIALNNPRVLDLLPGYPDHAFFDLELPT
jgi:hypothetical protein